MHHQNNDVSNVAFSGSNDMVIGNKESLPLPMGLGAILVQRDRSSSVGYQLFPMADYFLQQQLVNHSVEFGDEASTEVGLNTPFCQASGGKS